MSNKPAIAVVLSGCGVYDGAEIHESTLTLLALDRQGAAYQCFAPDVEQAHVVNHLNGEVSDESRNVLVESARIARGAIKDVKEFDAADFDAIIFPAASALPRTYAHSPSTVPIARSTTMSGRSLRRFMALANRLALYALRRP